MVGYYPQRQDGELLYSATARLAAAIYPGRSVAYCAERLLGSRQLTFGFLIPNNVDRLLENIPAVTGLNRESALEGSTYHLQAPLLNADERDRLSRSVFAGNSTETNGLRTFNARGSRTVLKYCVACARRDAALGKPAIWRVLHNHHGSVACAEHGTRLQISDAPLENDSLCDPAHWIKPDVASPPVATPAEAAIAHDFAWIYNQRGTNTPGFKWITAQLRQALLHRPEFLYGHRSLDTMKIHGAVQESLSAHSQPTFARLLGGLKNGCILSMTSRTTLQSYSLLAFLAGTSLRRIMSASNPESPDRASPDTATENSDDLLLWHKTRIEDYLKVHPTCSRSNMISALPHTTNIVRCQAPEWYERHMPKPRKHNGWRRPSDAICDQADQSKFGDWHVRDEQLCALATRYMAVAGASPFQSRRDALAKLNQSRSLMWRERGRLPKFRALLQSLIAPKKEAA